MTILKFYLTPFFPEDKSDLSARRGVIQGSLQLSLEYRKGALHVMVRHAKDLTLPDGSKEEPNSYVKVRATVGEWS